MMSSTWRARWLISITDMPLPCQSSNSSRMRSSTGSGSAPGPALKLCTRFTPRPATVDEPMIFDFLLNLAMSRIAEQQAATDQDDGGPLAYTSLHAADRPGLLNHSFRSNSECECLGSGS